METHVLPPPIEKPKLARQAAVQIEKTPVIYSLQQEPGVTVCRDAVRPTERYLRGDPVFVDYEAGFAHLPKWDLENKCEVGYTEPMAVFIESTEHFIGIPTYQEFRFQKTGVYTCPSELKPLYQNHGHFISSKKDLKLVRRTNNHHRAIAEIIVHRLGFKNRLKAFAIKVLKFLKLLTAVTAASAV